MAYYVTLYSGTTLDTNIPTSEAAGQKNFGGYATVVFGGEPAVITDPTYFTFVYNNSRWSWRNNGLQQGVEYLAAQRVEVFNAITNATAVSDYTPGYVKIKYFNDGIILLKGVYTDFPFHLEEESQAEPLSTPTGLNATNVTSNSARISWNAVENASGYKVEYRRQGDTTWNE